MVVDLTFGIVVDIFVDDIVVAGRLGEPAVWSLFVVKGVILGN